MNKEKHMNRKDTGMIIIISVFCVALIALLIVWASTREKTTEIIDAPVITEPDNVVVYEEVDRFVEVEKKITSKIIADGLNDMGMLITQEYYFTEVIEYESAKNLLGTDFVLPFTKSNFLASYDGEILAGVNFENIAVEMDEENASITITMPESEIASISIDNDSLKVYSEKEGIGNPISISDFNSSVGELKKTAVQKAREKGIMEKADENAKKLILNFIGSLVDIDTYSVEFTAAEQ